MSPRIQRTLALAVATACVVAAPPAGAQGQGSPPPQSVEVVNTPNVNVLGQPTVRVVGTTDVNVVRAPDRSVELQPDPAAPGFRTAYQSAWDPDGTEWRMNATYFYGAENARLEYVQLRVRSQAAYCQSFAALMTGTSDSARRVNLLELNMVPNRSETLLLVLPTPIRIATDGVQTALVVGVVGDHCYADVTFAGVVE